VLNSEIAVIRADFNSDNVILIVGLLILAGAVINRISAWPSVMTQKVIHGDAIRKIKLYLRLFRIPLVIAAISALCWIFIPYSITSFRGGLLATVLGVGFSIFAAESFKKVTEHTRLKKTLNFLRYVTAPYLESQASDILKTMNQYSGNLTFGQAQVLLSLVAGFDTLSLNFDKTWLQLVYSQDFMDAIRTDDQYYKIADVELEVLTFTKSLAGQSVRARQLAMSLGFITTGQETQLIEAAQEIRDVLISNARSLSGYSAELKTMIEIFLFENGGRREPPAQAT
jgi:hypothetical protein